MKNLSLYPLIGFVFALSGAGHAEAKRCSAAEVNAAAAKLVKGLYPEAATTNSPMTVTIRSAPTEKMIGVHLVESYSGISVEIPSKLFTQVSLDFVVRPANKPNAYGKTGCGLIGMSLPFFQAP